MALHRLWTQSTPPFGKFTDGKPGMTIANAFYVVGVNGWSCRGARVFWPAGATAQPLTLYAWSGNPSPLTMVQSATVQAVPGQWNEVLWPAPVPMGSAVPIWLGYSSQATDDYIAWTGAPNPAVGAEDGSPVYLAAGTEFGGRGRYRYARDAVPTEVLSFSAGVDIVADDGATPAPPPAPSGPGLSVWTGTAEVSATLSVWTGTAEAPVSAASLT